MTALDHVSSECTGSWCLIVGFGPYFIECDVCRSWYSDSKALRQQAVKEREMGTLLARLTNEGRTQLKAGYWSPLSRLSWR